MAFGTWRSPFPRSFGASSTKRIDGIYDAIVENLGDALTHEETSINAADDIAAARLLSVADRAIDRRVTMVTDPRLARGETLQRWEDILGIAASVKLTEAQRATNCATRLIQLNDAGSGGIDAIAAVAFDPWEVESHYNTLSTAVAYWPGNGYSTSWTSTLANVCVEYVRPATATDADVEWRRAACSVALDDILPAWATFTLSETPEGYDFGFHCDVSRLDYTCLGA